MVQQETGNRKQETGNEKGRQRIAGLDLNYTGSPRVPMRELMHRG